MRTLSKGYKVPESSDLGADIFTALEENIERLNEHSHDGANSEALSSASLQGSFTTITSASFVESEPGLFTARVTIPAGFNVDTCNVSFRDPTTKERVFLEFSKFSGTQIDVHTNFAEDYEVLVTT